MSLHQLRSGRNYKQTFVYTPNTMSRPSSPPVPGSISNSLSATHTPTIKLLHQKPSLKRFSGEDTAHSPLIFLQQCEDVMRNSNVVQDADKISFVRSQLVQDSLATVMMRANCFNTIVIGSSYSTFRENFLTTFGTSQDDSSLQWSFRLADSLTTDLGNLGILRGQAHAADFANEAITALQSAKWSENGKITLDRLRTVFEFQYYIMYLATQERRVASTIDFKPDQSLMDFASKLSKKLRDAPKAPVVPVAVVKADTKATLPPSPSIDPARTSVSATRSSLICSFCSKPGHRYSHCFQRKKQAAKSIIKHAPSSTVCSRADVASSKPSSDHSVIHSKPSRVDEASRTIMKQLVPPKFCHIHEYGNHSTEQCYTILRLKRNQVATVSTGTQKPSGEVSHPAQTHPP